MSVPSAGLSRIRTIGVGSASPLKLRAVSSVFSELIPAATISGVEVKPAVGPQPGSDAATLAGAEQRARAALEETGGELGVGVESGLQRIGGDVFASTWVVAMDRNGRVGAGSSGRLQLPEWLVAELEDGVELEAAIRRATGTADQGQRSGVLGLLTAERVTRYDAIREALQLAIAALHPPAPPR